MCLIFLVCFHACLFVYLHPFSIFFSLLHCIIVTLQCIVHFFPFLQLGLMPGLIWEAEPYIERAAQMNMEILHHTQIQKTHSCYYHHYACNPFHIKAAKRISVARLDSIAGSLFTNICE